MPSESQVTFFSRISAALTQRGPLIDLPEDLQTARVIQEGTNLTELFVQSVEQSGMYPHRVSGETALVEKVLELTATLSARTAIVPDEPMPSRETIIAGLKESGVQLLDTGDPNAAFEADVGITGVELAVAETASMSVRSGAGHRRLASLAVPAHIAIVRADQIAADLLDWGRLASDDPPANQVLISAMSKTADIEGILVPGVHGPGTVHVIILE